MLRGISISLYLVIGVAIMMCMEDVYRTTKAAQSPKEDEYNGDETVKTALSGTRRKQQCPKCKRYITASMLSAHIQEVHEKIKRYQCSECDYKHFRQWGVNIHLRKRHSGIPGARVINLSQSNDSDTTSTEEDTDILEVHESIKRYRCSECDYKSFRRSDVNTHIRKRHNGTSDACAVRLSGIEASIPEHIDQCPLCKRYIGGGKLQAHIQEVHGKIKRYRCSECDYRSFRQWDVNNHLLTRHSGIPGARVIKLSEAEALDATSADVEQTFSAGNGDEDTLEENPVSIRKRFKCSQCEYKSYSERWVHRHISKSHHAICSAHVVKLPRPEDSDTTSTEAGIDSGEELDLETLDNRGRKNGGVPFSIEQLSHPVFEDDSIDMLQPSFVCGFDEDTDLSQNSPSTKCANEDTKESDTSYRERSALGFIIDDIPFSDASNIEPSVLATIPDEFPVRPATEMDWQIALEFVAADGKFYAGDDAQETVELTLKPT